VAQPPILQAIATAVETTPFIGTLRRNPVALLTVIKANLPLTGRVYAVVSFKADTSCGSRFLWRRKAVMSTPAISTREVLGMLRPSYYSVGEVLYGALQGIAPSAAKVISDP
jgi:hypothetical protein